MNLRKIIREQIDLIFEAKLSDISLEDLNPKEIADDWLMANPEAVVNNYRYEKQEDYYMSKEEKEELMDMTIDEIQETEDFKKWLEYEVEVRFENAVDEIQDHIDYDGTIEIWREMTVDKNWLEHLIKQGKHLGIFWSFEEGTAEAHWGKFGSGQVKVKIKSITKEDYIDWKGTLIANMDPSIGEDEKEIRLARGTPIKIEEIEMDGKTLDIIPIKDKIFKA